MPRNSADHDEVDVKESRMPSTIGKRRIRKAVLEVSRARLATELAEATGTSKRTADQFLESLNRIAYREARKGEFTIPGIGKLVRRQRKASSRLGAAVTETVEFRVARVAKDSVLRGRS